VSGATARRPSYWGRVYRPLPIPYPYKKAPITAVKCQHTVILPMKLKILFSVES